MYKRQGLSHSEILGSILVCKSPRLIAAYHVFRRLQEPRHPPYALTLEGNIFVTTTGNIDIIRIDHMEKMKDQAIAVSYTHLKGETLADYWWCTLQALSFDGGKGPNVIVDRCV